MLDGQDLREQLWHRDRQCHCYTLLCLRNHEASGARQCNPPCFIRSHISYSTCHEVIHRTGDVTYSNQIRMTNCILVEHCIRRQIVIPPALHCSRNVQSPGGSLPQTNKSEQYGKEIPSELWTRGLWDIAHRSYPKCHIPHIVLMDPTRSEVVLLAWFHSAQTSSFDQVLWGLNKSFCRSTTSAASRGTDYQRMYIFIRHRTEICLPVSALTFQCAW